MNSETLETLLIARALEELSPEVEALLAQHLADHPEAAELATEFAETVALAKAALGQAAPRLALPPRKAAAPVFKPRFLAMAASFAIGAGLTFFSMRMAALPVPVAQAAKPIPPAPAPVPAPLDPSVRALPFWSKQRAYALAASKNSDQ